MSSRPLQMIMTIEWKNNRAEGAGYLFSVPRPSEETCIIYGLLSDGPHFSSAATDNERAESIIVQSFHA